MPVLPAELEAEFLNNVAVRRRYVLMFIMCFDVLCYLFRLLAKYVKNKASETSDSGSVLSSLLPQLLNMAFLYLFLGLLNWRSRRLGNGAARQVGAALMPVTGPNVQHAQDTKLCLRQMELSSCSPTEQLQSSATAVHHDMRLRQPAQKPLCPVTILLLSCCSWALP